jgi:putative transposase
MFRGHSFTKDVIVQAVYLKLRFSLSCRDVEELLSVRGVIVDHPTIQRWVYKFTPFVEAALKKRRKMVGNSWRMYETYIKVKGEWMYLYRAVDKEGNTVDFLLTKRRSKLTSHKFLNKAISNNGGPKVINIDNSGSNKEAIKTYNKQVF